MGYDGWTVLNNAKHISIKHDRTGRIFSIRKDGDFYYVYTINKMIDGPEGKETLVFKIDSIRKALMAIGFIRSEN